MARKRIKNRPLGVSQAWPRGLQEGSNTAFQPEMPLVLHSTGECRLFDAFPDGAVLIDLRGTDQRNRYQQNRAAKQREVSDKRKPKDTFAEPAGLEIKSKHQSVFPDPFRVHSWNGARLVNQQIGVKRR